MSKASVKGKSVTKPGVAPKPVGQERTVTDEERYRMIAEAAYFHAEKRGFVGGDAAEDWLQAESEIERYLREKLPATSPASKSAPPPSSGGA